MTPVRIERRALVFLLLLLLAAPHHVQSKSTASSFRSTLHYRQYGSQRRQHQQTRLSLHGIAVRGGDAMTGTTKSRAAAAVEPPASTTSSSSCEEELLENEQQQQHLLLEDTDDDEDENDATTTVTMTTTKRNSTNASTITTTTTTTTRIVEEQESRPTLQRMEPSILLQQQQPANNKKLELAVCTICVCATIATTIPVVILPLMAASSSGTVDAASFSATVASLSSLGGGVGQLFNGFVCQHFGGRRTSCAYLLGAGVCCLLLAAPHSSATYVGLVLAGLEFCTSVQWVACSVVLANRYAATNPGAYAQGITYMGLSSTFGTLGGKLVAPALLQFLSWRQLSRVGAVVACLGAIVMAACVKEEESSSSTNNCNSKQRFSAMESIRAVMGSRIFWIASVPYATAFLPRTGEKVLGNFYQGITNLPGSVCGGLTASVTVGFILGLVSSSSFHSLPSIAQKSNMLKRRFVGGVLASLLLAVSANQSVIQCLKYPTLMATILVLASGLMASSLAFQFYQLPNIIANSFGPQHNAVCLSFLDGVGFLASAPIWAFLGRLVRQYSTHGWSLAWTLVAVMYAIGGVLCTHVLPTILERQPVAAAVS